MFLLELSSWDTLSTREILDETPIWKGTWAHWAYSCKGTNYINMQVLLYATVFFFTCHLSSAWFPFKCNTFHLCCLVTCIRAYNYLHELYSGGFSKNVSWFLCAMVYIIWVFKVCIGETFGDYRRWFYAVVLLRCHVPSYKMMPWECLARAICWLCI